MTSFLDELRAATEHVRRAAVKELDVPGSGGKVTVRYRPPADRSALTPVLAALAVGGVLGPDEEAQLIVDCCDEILRPGDDGKLIAFTDGGPLRFDGGDERWGAGVNTAREAVAELFCLNDQPLAAARHAAALIDWLQGTDAELASRAEGNSVTSVDEVAATS